MYDHIAEGWVNLLTSGEYKQGQKYLRQDDLFCCLGVLCDYYLKTHPAAQEYWANSSVFIEKGTGYWRALPLTVLEWAGMRTATGELPHLGTTLSGLNDGGYNFRQISEIIKEHKEKL